MSSFKDNSQVKRKPGFSILKPKMQKNCRRTWKSYSGKNVGCFGLRWLFPSITTTQTTVWSLDNYNTDSCVTTTLEMISMPLINGFKAALPWVPGVWWHNSLIQATSDNARTLCRSCCPKILHTVLCGALTTPETIQHMSLKVQVCKFMNEC